MKLVFRSSLFGIHAVLPRVSNLAGERAKSAIRVSERQGRANVSRPQQYRLGEVDADLLDDVGQVVHVKHVADRKTPGAWRTNKRANEQTSK
jgi:hypothetical protein